MKFIGKILPVDGYYVSLKGNLPVDYAISLTHLYQPLIGMHAVILYQTLLHDIALQQESTMQTHHTLMNYLNIPLDEIYEARLKLEGIGLLNTYENNRTTNKSYLYELQSPFAPNNFFQDAMLSQLLFHQLGEMKYDFLRLHYISTPIYEQSENITVSFNDVFKTIQPSLDNIASIAKYQAEEGPKVDAIDFTWMEQMLKQRMIPVKKVLTKENKRVITQMMALYDLTSHELDKTVLWALTDENILDIDEFKEACHDLFTSKNDQMPKQIISPNEVKKEKQTISKPKTKEEQLIYELETISPKQLLADLSTGNQASEQDMKVIREVMTSQGLPSPVMNVLIHYVLLQSNMKLSKAYLEKIASHWSRANLKTAKEAMQFAKQEKNRFQQKTTAKQSNYRNFNKKGSNEIVPDWFKERNTNQQSQVVNKPPIDMEKEKEEITELLKQYSNLNKNNHFQG